MTNEMFVLALGIFYAVIFAWGFKVLPGERWQVLASVPRHKTEDDRWNGLNLTYYGFFIACSYTMATTVMFILFGSALMPVRAVVVVSVLMAAACVPASKWVAGLVEKKSHTRTVGGAAFVGLIFAPGAVGLANTVFGPYMGFNVDMMSVLAAFSVAYAFGEGTGRLACISFGCCYGKPLSECHPLIRRLFRRFHFVFTGKTKKIAYASGLEGEPVVPIQAVTSAVYVTSALVGVYLFLANRPAAAFIETAVVTQVWRFLSEFFRADYRGTGRLSAYQWMSLVSVGYVLLCGAVFPGPSDGIRATVVPGLRALWDPAVLIFLQGLWVAMFLVMGRSTVTGSVISLHVVRDRV